ncbi:fructose PTS transporter subunit IIA [Cryobacterium sp. 5B3]|uniref:PTS sugar transporter subunit IIA n=1 Tax=Cryobacterium sp. 5B3 TaxID=3048586 RepID=UPI002AB528C0|nr:fructose PTS transporter subunit IIA [Cryobacterium sp. 5B3]MDY7542311.1 fructose PTS transporter subunit IIA [Cryobacterium sp. 5B3]MEB0276520.1 fructose PTS transporter subunit IIA [Cryobacterium sp. 5B3]
MPAHLDSVLHGGSITAVVGAVSGMPTFIPALIAVALIVAASVVIVLVIVRHRAARRTAATTSATPTATGTTGHPANAATNNAGDAPHISAGLAPATAGKAPGSTQPTTPGSDAARAAASVPASATAPEASAVAPAPGAPVQSLVHPKAEPVVITTPHPKRTLATMTMPLTTAIPIVPTTTTGSLATGRKTVLDYIDERTIVLDVDETDRDRMIRTLAGMMSTTGRITDVGLVAQSAFRRETHGTTSMGNGIAIAHAKCDAVLAPVLAFARSKHGIDWNSADGEKATLIFMIAVPKASAGTEHLRVLSQLSRCLAKPAFRAAIQSAQTPAAVLEALAISANLKKPEHPQA